MGLGLSRKCNFPEIEIKKYKKRSRRFKRRSNHLIESVARKLYERILIANLIAVRELRYAIKSFRRKSPKPKIGYGFFHYEIASYSNMVQTLIRHTANNI